jgi:gluconolactonase
MKRLLLALIPAAFIVGCSEKPAPAPTSVAPTNIGVGSIVRLDPALDAILSKDAAIEKLAGGFTFIEGPLWRPSGVLWFSDVVGDVVRQCSPDGKVADLFRPGGSDGVSLPAGGFNGPNGMTADKDGASCSANTDTAGSSASRRT